jgi:hypothetical protein
MALKSQVCSSNGQEGYLTRDGCVFIAHTPKTSRWKDFVHLAIRPQFNSRSDHHTCKGYFQNQNLTTGGAGGETVSYTEADGLTGHPRQSDHPRTKVGGLISPDGGQTGKGSLGRPRTIFNRRIYTQYFLRFQ